MPSFKLFSIVGTLLFAGSAYAADSEDLFKALDKDNDGVVTKDEVGAVSKRHFDRLLRLGDRDFDGKLTLEEFKFGATEPQSTPAPGGQLVGRGRDRNMAQNFDPNRVFRFLDKNGDDKIEYSEIPEQAQRRMKPLFDRIGKDSITKEEFTRFSRLRQGNANQTPNARPKMEMKNEEPNTNRPTASKSPTRPGKGNKKPAQRFGNGRGAVTFLFNRYDRNKDGSLSQSEAPDRMKQNFDRIDADGNGAISKTEIESMISRMQQRSKTPGTK